MTSRPGADAAWSAACLRLEDYLRAHRVQDRALALRLTLRILDQARVDWPRNPGRSPVEQTMAAATALTESWFAMLAGGDPDDPQSVARGRVAYFATEAYRKWPSAFLDPNPPAELVESVRRMSLQAGPQLEFTSLIRAEVDYGPVEEIARETWSKFSWAHALRAFVVWTVVFFAAWYAWLRFAQ